MLRAGLIPPDDVLRASLIPPSYFDQYWTYQYGFRSCFVIMRHRWASSLVAAVEAMPGQALPIERKKNQFGHSTQEAPTVSLSPLKAMKPKEQGCHGSLWLSAETEVKEHLANKLLDETLNPPSRPMAAKMFLPRPCIRACKEDIEPQKQPQFS